MELIIVFRLEAERFGLEVAHVQEVVESATLHYIPKAPDQLLGAINFHGSILPVLNLAPFLGFSPAECDPRLIVLPPQLCALALAVTAIDGILPLDRDELQPSQQDDAPIRGVLNHADGMINLLDLDQVIARLEEL